MWSSYGGWSDCSVTCGTGFKQSIRNITQKALHGGNECKGGSTRTESCIEKPCSDNPFSSLKVDCSWSPWYAWSKCSKTCGGGERVSNRTISVVAHNGGKECEGIDSRMEECNTETCFGSDCRWSPFSEWSECSKTCGGGVRRSTRKVLQIASDGGRDCLGDYEKIEGCNKEPCPGTILQVIKSKIF